MTGIASGKILNLNLKEATDHARVMNQVISEKIEINSAARITCIKPSGTTSCVLGCSSGIHAWHNDYYLRTIRFGMNEAIAHYFMDNHPGLWEIDELRPQDTICVRFPIAAPKDSILRTETAIDTLERVKKFSIEWIKPGHINGDNTHNVSATISIDKSRMYAGVTDGITSGWYVDNHNGWRNEWEMVGEWMWNNREFYNGLSVLPYWGGTYSQAPFEDITEEEYNKRSDLLKDIDLTKVTELDDNVEFSQTNACSGSQCEINL